MDVPALASLITDIQRSMRPSADLDRRIAAVIGGDGEPGKTAPCTSSTDAALLAVLEAWWWTVSHLEAEVMPTAPGTGAPIADGMDWEKRANPAG